MRLRRRIPSPEELLLVYGDTEGCVNILIFFAAREIFRLLTNVERRKGIPTITFDRFIDSFKCDYVRWQVHREWIGKMRRPLCHASRWVYSSDRMHQLRCTAQSDHLELERSAVGRRHWLHPYQPQC